jgi:outer membrane protein OmpA-like peptidoglycan-associated protein
MRKLTFPLAWVAGIAVLGSAGCESMSEREQGTAKGAGIGAVAGAVLGGVSGNNAGRGAVIGGAVGAVAGNLWSKRMEDKRRALEQSTQGSGVAVEKTSDNRLRVNVPADVSFATGSSAISPTMRATLDSVANNVEPTMQVTVVGHTDSTGSAALNEALSLERATAVRDYLAVRGVAGPRIGVFGRGAREPVADNDSDAGRARNRRVEIFLAEPAQG